MTTTLSATVIINNYNYGEFLANAIDSALTQTYEKTQVVVVDDGSTDDSRDVIARYGGRIVPVLKDNGGQASAFNAGFAASGGNIVIFLDADDMLTPEAVDTAVKSFRTPPVVNVRWPLWEIDERGDKTGAIVPRVALAHGDLREVVKDHGPVIVANAPTSGNAWTRAFLRQVSPVQECGDKHGADGYLCNLAAACGIICAVPWPLGYYRVHPRSFSPRTAETFIRRDLQRYPQLASSLAAEFARQGLQVDTRKWQGAGTSYDWMTAMLRLGEEVVRVVPEGRSLILVDDGLLGRDFIAGRRATPFLERNGEYWGPPPDDPTAIAELEKLRAAGSDFILFISSSFWWLEHYSAFRSYLEAQFDCPVRNDHMILFNLRAHIR